MKIIIFGAGKVGQMLVKILLESRHKVTIVDENRELCDEVAAETNAQVVCGDAADPDLLDELKIGEADHVFAVTGNEETNFLLAVYAKNANAKNVISRASEAKYSNLMERLGVEPLIPESTLARELSNRVLSPLISLMLDPNNSNIELRERDVNGKMAGKKVKKVEDENKFTIVSVYQDDKFIFPHNDFKLKKEMRIVVVKHKL
jgi:trk system potassium uptake protein TrkA